MTDQEQMTQRLAELQQRRAKARPEQSHAAATPVTRIPAAVASKKRKKRGHAAASTRVILAGAAISLNVILMSFMGPFVKVDPVATGSAATASEISPTQKIIVEVRREVAGGEPPIDDPSAPGWVSTSSLPSYLASAPAAPVAAAQVLGAPMVAPPAPPAAPVPAAAAPAAASPAPVAAPAPTPAPAVATPTPAAAAPAAAAPPPPPRTSASG